MQISRDETVWSESADDLDRLRGRFRAEYHLRLPGFLEANLLEFIQDESERGEFYTRTHDEISVELCMSNKRVLHLLTLLMNDPRLLRWVEEATGCGPIECFTGRVYRMAAGAGHYDSWHTDAVSGRIVGMSINLGPVPYSGGVFQLRETSSGQLLCELENTGPGDAILFPIARHLTHRVTAVTTAVPKTAFAGWFQSEPGFLKSIPRETVFGPR